MKELYWKYSLIIFIIVMGLFLVRQAQPFTNGILGAFTLFVMLRRPTYRLQKRIKPNAAVWIMTIATVLFILIPVSLLGWLLVNELVSMNLNPKEIIAPIIQIIRLIKEKTGFDVLSENTITYLTSQIPAWGQSLMYGVSDVFMNIVVAVMLLYFMLSGGEKMEAYIATLLPFKEENKKEDQTQDHTGLSACLLFLIGKSAPLDSNIFRQMFICNALHGSHRLSGTVSLCGHRANRCR